MAITSNMTDSWLFYQNLNITTDIDIEEEIESSFILNTHLKINQLNNVIVPVSTTEILFSDNIPTQVNERAHISIVEMDEQTPNKYRAFFIYEDLFSKYVILKPLKDVSDTEIVEKLIDIFFLFGAPRILQSNHGRGYTENLVKKLRTIIPTLNIVHGNVLRRNENCKDFKTLIESWKQKSYPKPWYEGLNFIQAFENTSKISEYENKESQKTPAKIFFESNPANDLAQVICDENFCDEIWTEEDLINNTIRNDLTQSYQKDLNTSVEIEISHEHEKTDKIHLTHETAVNEEKSDDDEVYKSATLICSNDSIDSNDKKENIDSSNLPSVKSEALIEMQNTVAKKRALSSENIFECSMCNRIFRRINYLKNHMRSHKSKVRNGNKYQNDVVFRTNSETDQLNNNSDRIINNHNEAQIKVEKKVTGNAKDEIKFKKHSKRTVLLSKSIIIRTKLPLECKFCKKTFTFRSILERHLRIHTNERPYFCKICNKSFKQLGHLNQHAMSHIDFRSYQCPICYHKFESHQVLKDHIISHKGNNDRTTTIQKPYRLYECDICKKVFTAKSVLEGHIFTHTHERLYSCETCNKTFKRAVHLRSHTLVHTGMKKFACTICFKRFNYTYALKKHILIHTGYKPHQCKVCGKRFFEKRILDRHLFTHTGQKPHVCTTCGKKYTLADTLKRHISIAHGVGRTFQCEICNKMFKQLSHLVSHKKVHTDERPFQCHVCDKSFKYKNVLKCHFLVHSNFRPFECDDCKATFARKSNLQIHITSTHMNERPYSCYICNKTFKQNNQLNAHLAIHRNRLPYQCPYCYTRCNRLDNLKKHIQLHERYYE